jgi:hypothetical protein
MVPKMTATLTDGMIPDWIDMILVGHIHLSRIGTLKTKSGREIPFVSPGSLHLCSIDEEPNKKMYFLGSDGSIWSKPLLTRRVIVMDFCGGTETEIRERTIKMAASLQNPKKNRPDTIKTPIVRVVYDGTTVPKVRSMVETALRNEGVACHLFYSNKAEKVENELNTIVEEGLNSSFMDSGFDHAKTAFQGLERDKIVRNLVETILESPPVQESYQKLKETFSRRQQC